VFELTTPENRIVVEYKNYNAHLLAVRNTQSGQEYHLEDLILSLSNPTDKYFQHTFWSSYPKCPSHKLNNTQEVMAFVGSKPPFEQEGLVVLDRNFNRVKVKSLAYVSYNRARDASANNPRAVMQLILSEQLDDVAAVLEPHVAVVADQLKEGLKNLIQATDEAYKSAFEAAKGAINPKKEFALMVQNQKAWMSPLMDRFSGNCEDTKDYIYKKKQVKTNDWKDSFLDNLVDLSLKAK
jgi:hypothetical protein